MNQLGFKAYNSGKSCYRNGIFFLTESSFFATMKWFLTVWRDFFCLVFSRSPLTPHPPAGGLIPDSYVFSRKTFWFQ